MDHLTASAAAMHMSVTHDMLSAIEESRRG